MKPIECLLQCNVTVEIIAPMLADSALAFSFDEPIETQEQLRTPMSGDATGLVEIDPHEQLQRQRLLRAPGLIEPVAPEAVDLVH